MVKENSGGNGSRYFGSVDVPLAACFSISVSWRACIQSMRKGHTYITWSHTSPAPCNCPAFRFTSLHEVFDRPITDTSSSQIFDHNFNTAVLS